MRLDLSAALIVLAHSTFVASQQAAWINEFYYDNVGADTGEFVEVAYLEGTSIAPYKVYHYNGDGGGVITNKALTAGTCVNGICYTFVNVGLQNGPDGKYSIRDTTVLA
jgi:hypothetical protein